MNSHKTLCIVLVTIFFYFVHLYAMEQQKDQARPGNITELPHEIIVKILQQVNICEMHQDFPPSLLRQARNLMLTCRKFKEALRCTRLEGHAKYRDCDELRELATYANANGLHICKLKVRNYSDDLQDVMPNEYFSALTKLRDLEDLSIIDHEHGAGITAPTFCDILWSLQSLKNLTLHIEKVIQNPSEQQFIGQQLQQHPSNLTTIHILNKQNIALLHLIVQNCPHLTSIEYRCDYDSDSDMSDEDISLLQPTSTEVEILTIKDNRDQTAITDRSLGIIGTNFPSLRSLIFKTTNNNLVKGFKELGTRCPQLEELSIFSVGDSGLDAIFGSCRNLKFLKIKFPPSGQSVKSPLLLPKLQKLCFPLGQMITTDGLQKITQRTPALQNAILPGCPAQRIGHIFAVNCRELEFLNLSGSTIVDADLLELAKRCPNLKTLIIGGQNCKITTEGIIAFHTQRNTMNKPSKLEIKGKDSARFLTDKDALQKLLGQ